LLIYYTNLKRHLVNVSNDELYVRTKFIFVTWIGSDVKVMRKAKLSVHVSDVKRVLRVSHYLINLSFLIILFFKIYIYIY
jgi:hypothetical protein